MDGESLEEGRWGRGKEDGGVQGKQAVQDRGGVRDGLEYRRRQRDGGDFRGHKRGGVRWRAEVDHAAIVGGVGALELQHQLLQATGQDKGAEAQVRNCSRQQQVPQGL